MIEQLVKGELGPGPAGRRMECTVLHSALHGFPAVTDGHSLESMAGSLNQYFEAMIDVLFVHGGTLDKLAGDELIGLFGAPTAGEESPFQAVRCALDMMSALDELNGLRVDEDQPAIQMSIAIATGEMLVGTMGSPKAMHYTALGDAVTLNALRLAVAKPGEILLSAATYSALSERIEATSEPWDSRLTASKSWWQKVAGKAGRTRLRSGQVSELADEAIYVLHGLR